MVFTITNRGSLPRLLFVNMMYQTAKNITNHWDISLLSHRADAWSQRQAIKHGAIDECSQWWPFIWDWKENSGSWIKEFSVGSHTFSPMLQYNFSDEVVRVFSFLDQLIVHSILKILQPTFKYVISSNCLHLAGPSVIKSVTTQIKSARDSQKFNYYLRFDIKGYYASINHQILIAQCHEHFDDKIVLRYLENIITIAVDKGGQVFLPKSGIPRRSSLSPFFGALYLSKLDHAFSSMPGVFYRRFMDDGIVLVKTKRQYTKARKILFTILKELKLKISPHKTKMGMLKNGFHYLGVKFESSRNTQTQIQLTTAALRSRGCRRALDKVKAMSIDAVNPVQIQGYLSRWAGWWATTIRLSKTDLLYQWVAYAKKYAPEFQWMGSGLVLTVCSISSVKYNLITSPSV